MSLPRRTPLSPMSGRRRAQYAAAGQPVPYSTLTARRDRESKPAKRPRVAPAVSADVRAVLLERSGGWCEMTLPGCLGRGTDPAHRIGRKAGGRKRAGRAANNRPSNALWACRVCHNRSEAHPAWSYRLGLMLREGQMPAREPVVRRGVLVYLADDGRVLTVDEAAA